LGSSALPGSGAGETSSSLLLVIWLGINTFRGRRIGHAGRAMNTAASPSPKRCLQASVTASITTLNNFKKNSMYDDYEGPVSFYGVFKVVVGIAIIYMVALSVDKFRDRKLRFTIIDILKFIWMIVSVIFCFYMIILYFSSNSIDEYNSNFDDLLEQFLPFKKGFLGAVTSFVAYIFIGMFCMLGIGTYFENPTKIENNQNNTKPNS
jgi:hypothetical protein